MEKLDFQKLNDDYNNQINNLRQYISNDEVNLLISMLKKSDRYFFDVSVVSMIYNRTPEIGKDSFFKIIYFELIEKYRAILFNSQLKSPLYYADNNYNINAYLGDVNPLLAFNLKYDDTYDNKKIVFNFYDDLMENCTTLELNKKIVNINEQLYEAYKRNRCMSINDIYFGGSDSLIYVEKSEFIQDLYQEYNKIYVEDATKWFQLRKQLLNFYLDTLECGSNYYNIDRKNIKTGDKITFKQYPYMDLSVVFTNERDIENTNDNPKVIVKK